LQVAGEHAIKAEIAARGPIACSLCATDEFEAYAGGIFRDTTNCTDMNHSIEIAGWGEEGGVKFYIGRNSWGTYWFVCFARLACLCCTGRPCCMPGRWCMPSWRPGTGSRCARRTRWLCH
jgi:hypothetical protein